MALIFTDSFAHYAIADINRKWTSKDAFSTTYLDVGTSYGRNGRSGLKLRVNNGTTQLTKTFTATDTLIIGFWYKPTVIWSSDYDVIRLYDGSTLHVSLTVSGNRWVVKSGGTTLGTASYIHAVGLDCYVELKVKIADSPDGTVDLRVNGVSYISETGKDTRNAGNASVDTISLGYNSAGYWEFYMADLYVCNGTSPNNSFLGDVKVECLYPSGAGATTAWTPSAAPNYECVNETSANGDTDYVSSSTANQIDTYAMGNLAITAGTIYAVQYILEARKDDVGSRSIAPVARPSVTDRVGTTVSLADAYVFYLEPKDVSPETSSAWTISEVNGMEFGVKLIA